MKIRKAWGQSRAFVNLRQYLLVLALLNLVLAESNKLAMLAS